MLSGILLLGQGRSMREGKAINKKEAPISNGRRALYITHLSESPLPY